MRVTHRLMLTGAIATALMVGVSVVTIERHLGPSARSAGQRMDVPDNDAKEAVRRELLVGGLFTLVVALIAARVLSGPVVRPLDELREVAQALAGGDLTQRPSPAIRGGEVGALADALRRMAEQMDSRLWEMQSEEALLVALTESLNEGVVAVDARKRVIRINETGRQLLGVRHPTPFSAGELPAVPMLQQALQLVLSGSPALQRELHLEGRTMQLTARALRGGGAILALYDLTALRRLESVRQDFVANVSHELRTPLTVIGGFVETLKDEELPPELRRQFLGMAEGNVQRMQRIVDDLLDLSRIESGGWVPNPEMVDLADVAAEVFAPLQRPAVQKGVALRVILGEGGEQAYCDPTAVRQILSNLSQNALRHTAAGEVVLFSRPEADGTWIGVRDTGAGIAAEHLPRIFERFYRADPGRSREMGGTGLGLAIVRHLTEAHGGRVQVESTVGTGTTIAVWLPHQAIIA